MKIKTMKVQKLIREIDERIEELQKIINNDKRFSGKITWTVEK